MMAAVSTAAQRFARLRSALAWACQLDELRISRSSKTLALGLDSLSLLSVITEIELAFGLEFSAEHTLALLEASTVGDLADGIERLFASCASRFPNGMMTQDATGDR